MQQITRTYYARTMKLMTSIAKGTAALYATFIIFNFQKSIIFNTKFIVFKTTFIIYHLQCTPRAKVRKQSPQQSSGLPLFRLKIGEIE